MANDESEKIDLLFTAIVAAMTSYWLVDIIFDSFCSRESNYRILFDILFFFFQVAVVHITWRTLKSRRKLQSILIAERQAAIEDKNRTQTILDSIGEGLSIQDRSFNIIYQNKVHMQLVGNDCHGQVCYEAYSARDAICSNCPVKLTFEDGQNHILEKRVVRSVDERFVEIVSSPIFNQNREVVSVIELVRDVTHRVKTEKKILDLNRELRQQGVELAAANHDLESFNHSLSHDLRSPLTQIVTAIDLLQEQLAKDRPISKEHEFLINTIREGSHRIDEMIQGMLDLARLGQGELNRASVDLSAMASTIVTGLQRRHPSRTVMTSIAPGLQTNADPRLAQIVMQNLLENAWKYTQHTSMAMIEVGIVQNNRRRGEFFVRDNGAGFNSDFLHRIFFPFQRFHDAKDFSGDGIGLSTVYRIIKRHGGSIHAAGEVNKGATFTFSFEEEKICDQV